MIISGSLLNADQANLVSCVHLAEKGGIDEIHFDVTNGIYVRNISFGPQTVADVQKIASVPVDIHLELDNTLDMIDHMALCIPAVLQFRRILPLTR